jgi:hypothetical protein
MIKEWIENLHEDVVKVHQGPGPFFWPIGGYGQQCGAPLAFDATDEAAITEALEQAGFSEAEAGPPMVVRVFKASPKETRSNLSLAQQRLIALDLRKPEIEAYYEQLESTLDEVAKEIGINGYFRALDGIVYKITIPEGHFVSYKRLAFVRTKREGERAGSLSVKEAEAATAAGQVK